MRNTARTSMLALVALASVFSLAAAAEKSPPLPLPVATKNPATATFDQLREGIRQHYSRLWAIDVEYHAVTEGAGAPFMKYHFAMKGEKRFKRQVEADGRANGWTYDGEGVTQEYQEHFKEAYVQKRKEPFSDVDIYARVLGIPLSDFERANVSWLPYLMPSGLDAREMKWSVQPTLDVVDGAECHVLVARYRQRIWVDPSIGFATRFFEEFSPEKGLPQAEWPLLQRCSCSLFEKTNAGVYLPKRVQVVRYVPATNPRNTWNQPSSSTVLDVKNLAAGDDVRDGLFRFEFPPGTQVRDQAHGRFYRVGNSGEELDMLVGKGQEELAKSRRGLQVLVLVLNVAVLGALAVWYFYRARRRRHAR